MRELGAEQTRIWERIAPFWDGLVGDQDDASAWRQPLLGLIDITPGETILDVGCGNGRFARVAASQGATVVAIDGSRAFIEIARTKQTDQAARITYQVVDATDLDQLMALGSRRFDSAVANMVLMNLADVAPLAGGLAHLLKPGGAFVFSVPHPCFPWGDAVGVGSQGGARARGSLRAFNVAGALHARLPSPLRRRIARAALPLLRARKREYLTSTARMTASPGQPTPHYHFYRPLQDLLAPFFEAGFALDAVREPANPLSLGAEPIEPEIPNLFVGRLRLVSASS
jgi:2-polyprenyl-3-methyl-5-hydroxy-6-metoxy-1,4-benzoquinol methylase